MRNASLVASRKMEARHAQTLTRKEEKIAGLEALIEMWVKVPNVKLDYLRKLRYKLHCAKSQRKAMKD